VGGFLHIYNDTIPTAAMLGQGWLKKILPDFGVKSVAVSPVGAGQLGDTYRLDLGYHLRREGDPASLICKIASSDAVSRKVATEWSLYIREVGFYRELAPSALVTTPIVHASGLAEDGSFFLLMEDVKGAVPGNQLAGMQVPQAAAAMREAARLHASYGRGVPRSLAIFS
jgi:hypothetical protein